MLSKPGLILQHGEDGPPGRFADWLDARGIASTVHRVWEEPLPSPQGLPWIASLGSERSAGERDGWVPEEVSMLRAAAAADVPVLGLCFGGQALSSALGGAITTLEVPEIGWYAVDPIDGGAAEIPPGPWLQYHFDLMQVPPGARELARSPAGPSAFRHGRHLGLQFHPEVDAALVDLWARTDPKLPQTGVTPESLARQSARYAEPALEQAFDLFDRWWASLTA